MPSAQVGSSPICWHSRAPAAPNWPKPPKRSTWPVWRAGWRPNSVRPRSSRNTNSCVEAPEACPIDGHPVAIELALRNLIENALAHTPHGSAVTVRVRRGPPVLEVLDNGAAVEGAAGVDPRHRHLGLGLGLGHQLVRRVASIHDGRFEADPVSPDGSRCYRLVFPDPVQPTNA